MSSPRLSVEELIEFGRAVITEYDGIASDAAHDFNIAASTARERFRLYKQRHYDDYLECCVGEDKADQEIIAENVKYKKQAQRYADLNKVERKAFRESARVENAVETFAQAISENLKLATKSWGKPPKATKIKQKGIGLIHLSDLHCNERVDLPQNKYDFNICGDRVRHHIRKSMAWFKANGINSVCLAMTADMMNSDRRLDELQANADNRSRAVIGIIDILIQAIRELRENGFGVTVTWVNGNESRVPKDRGWQEKVASDTYDEVIGRALQLTFHHYKDKGVQVVEPIDPNETIMCLAGHNVLMLHGDSRIGGNADGAVQSITGKYARRGITIDFTIFGHIHAAQIGDYHARSGSTVGDNAYSDKALNIAGKPSQNVHIFFEDGSVDSCKIDLSAAPEEGYRTHHEFETYNTKSKSKAMPSETIFQVVV